LSFVTISPVATEYTLTDPVRFTVGRSVIPSSVHGLIELSELGTMDMT
jgi:hypothetical protein